MVDPQRLSDVFRAVGPLYREAAQRVARDEHVEGVTTGVRAVLEQLDAEGPQTVPAVARALGTSRQYVQRMADDAAADRLVRYAANPSHRRSQLLHLTSRGTATIGRILRREHATLGAASRSLDDASVDACLRVLRTLRDTLAADGAQSPQ